MKSATMKSAMKKPATRKRLFRRLFAFVLLCTTVSLAFVWPMRAIARAGDNEGDPQETVELRGTVVDETNAYIVGAKLTLEDASGYKRTTQSDDRGHYRIAVKPGAYTLTVEVEGFAKFIQPVDLTNRRQLSLDPQLKIEIKENVEIKDNSAMVSTEPDQNLSAITITEKDLDALPDDPDELLDVLKQMAGAAGAGELANRDHPQARSRYLSRKFSIQLQQRRAQRERRFLPDKARHAAPELRRDV